ncbi:right-handed parallel beta-helix repeat-containing protein [Verrucomicrobiaceae bacterium N1E253]|uniref:Right-handed parallel beta-helix repeat-containing protein n=2 Tax=Oceaniferula marina TaxID=2748318 RepID=A0A851GEU0_9BACT|nr:right-handed parallel beta-helix repeat-containing protein [Oceaniferula marina]
MTEEKRSQNRNLSGTLVDHEVHFLTALKLSIVSSVLRSGITHWAAGMAVMAAMPCLSAKEYHVSPRGNDTSAGTFAAPLRHIAKAAELAMPGDVITVHEGVYRERIDPPRGGTSDEHRIVYRAAEGETVVIKGSEVVKGWTRVQGDIWKVEIPNVMFGDFNPFQDLIRGDWFKPNKRKHHTAAVYLNGHWLTEAAKKQDVFAPTDNKPLWFSEPAAGDATTVWAQFMGVDPNTQLVEVNARQSVFYPSKTGVNYITLRGFILEQAATPWAPPTAEQIGLVGTHWSKGWVIENNTVRYSTCTGITLGKHGDKWDNTSANSAGGYVKTIERAYKHGWNGQNIGHHIVRGNHISHCEQAGIVGSLGAVFSKIIGNEIHDIHVRRLFSGHEMAGMKFHGALDSLIEGNHVYRCSRGIWLDWMTQGTRVTKNLLHDNKPREDIFLEVNHGPVMLDHNVLLSEKAMLVNSQGGAYAHNLFAGNIQVKVGDAEGRRTPWLKEHSTEMGGLDPNRSGDERYYNNVFIGKSVSLAGYDKARMDVFMAGNVFLQGATPSRHSKDSTLSKEHRVGLKLEQKDGAYHLNLVMPDLDGGVNRFPWVTSKLLGKVKVPRQAYLQPDGSQYHLKSDYHGSARNGMFPVPGPFEIPEGKEKKLKVWSLHDIK